MKLRDYLSNPHNDLEDMIFLDKVEKFYKEKNNNDDFIYYQSNHHKTQNDLYSIFDRLRFSDRKIKLLITNPDIDIPFLKQEIIHDIENREFTKEYQNFWDNQQIEFFVDDVLLSNIPENLHVFCHANIIKHDKITMVPLGRDPKGYRFLENKQFDLENKNTLCYLNFSTPPEVLHWYGRIREYIFLALKDKDFITVDNVKPNNNRDIYGNFINYYETLSKSKFMIAPRGCGLDTYRLWDSIYMGTIPIVIDFENNTGYHQFKDLPIIFIKNWQEYNNLTREFLEEKWLEILDIDFNYDKLYLSYWKNIINS
jgi:hypothetical protein